MKAPKKPAIVRRDATGHLNPKYAADLRAKSREGTHRDDGVAFLEKPKSRDPLAEALGEEFLETATSGEEATTEDLNRDVPEELGGPFIETSAREEFARGKDPSNPKSATREPFPTALSNDGELPLDEEEEPAP